jgi:transposase
LETANITLAALATAVRGKSGRDLITALMEGTTDATALADLARGLFRKRLPQLQEMLLGRVQPPHPFVLRHILAQIDLLDATPTEVVTERETHLDPSQEERTLLQRIPGIQATTAAMISAERGKERSVFPFAHQRSSWAVVCPGNRQRGGKRLSGALTKGKPYRRSVLTQVAWALSPTRDHDLCAPYHRLARRIGRRQAIVAISRRVLVMIAHVLRTK